MARASGTSGRLLADKKLVTHSVRSWENMTEDQIRGIFRAART